MTQAFEEANAALRQAVGSRIAAVAAGKPAEKWYDPQDENSPTIMEIIDRNVQALDDPRFDDDVRLVGDSLLGESVHPTSQAFFDLCDQLKEMHRRKSRDYGCPTGGDPLANIRNGAKFVGIAAWRGAMVRLSDKVTRLAAYNATGRLENESLEDNLFDLASYSLLALLLHREERHA
ncbi:MAG: hypothetical protein EBR40_10480 [Proteobacteria bacterium]|nr:hypothetical protein [Pseudomonadota bacterium]